MRILILEDNVLDADFCIRSIHSSLNSCLIDVAPTLKKARELLNSSTNYDVALLDMNLPDGTGLEFLTEIRELGLPIPVVVFTSSGNEEVAVAALKAGADDYISKKINYTEMLPTVITHAIKNHQQQIFQKNELIDVLYIEHNLYDIDLTNRHLKKYAPYIHLDSVSSAEEALRKLPGSLLKESNKYKYQIILMDYRLQGMTALDFIKIIRQERNHDIPIIVVTGQGDEEISVQALKLGATDYLTKNDNYLYRLPYLIKNAYQQSELSRKQVELVESEAKYRLLADNAGDVIFMLDMDLNYTYISPAIKALRGFEPEEAIKQKIIDVLTPESYQRAIKILSESLYIERKLMKNLLPQKNIELEMIRKDGSTVWTEVKASLMTNEDDSPIGILGVTRDIAKRKFALDELRKLQRAVEQSPESIFITNTKGEIEYVNPVTQKLSGYSHKELIGQNPRIFSSGKTPKSVYKTLWHTISKGKIWEGEFQNKKKCGELYWEAATISPVTDQNDKITHYLAIRKDITEQKRITQELMEAKEHAEESDRLKSAFLANMSHEIRTPMNGILGFSDLLRDPDLKSEEKESYIEILHLSGQRMLNTVNDIIEISKIESGMVSLNQAPINVNSKLEEQVQFFAPEASAKGLKLMIEKLLPEASSTIVTDQQKLDSILSNLIKNAIKYTDHGSVKIGCSAKKNHLEFYILDTGIGIPVNRRKAIFDRFVQADIGDKRAFQGSGLGLSIAKAYVEMMDGTIWVKSEEGKGSCFYFTLPCCVTIEENKSKMLGSQDLKIEDNPARKASEMKILIAEDDEVSEMLLTIEAKKIGKEIFKAGTGVMAVDICLHNPDIDLVFMDIKMPEMDGYEATRQIRKFNKEVIIIAQTAYGLAGDREKALEAGANDYISKPIIQEKLQTLLRKYFD